MPGLDRNNNDKTRTHVVLTKGTMVSHYRIAGKIGAGGMGEVYLAEDTELDRTVALKFLPPRLCQDDDCRARFKREARATAQLSHPNIIQIYEVSEYNGRPFYAMEYISGQSLRGFIRDNTLSIVQVLEISLEVCAGLQEAHESGIIHRDIKPANILLDAKGRVRIVDFGLARVGDVSRLTKSGSTLGTVGYMSPEQVRGEAADYRSDIFSFGVVLYEMLAGRSPFHRDSDASTLHAVVNDTPEPIARFKADIPDELQRIVSKAIDKDRDTRYQHADDMRADLKRLQQGFSQPSFRTTSSIHPIRKMRTLVWTVATLGVITVLIVAYYGLIKKSVTTQQPTVTKRQITRFGNVMDCDISPDGSLITYVRKDDTGYCHLYVQDMTGSAPVEVYDEYVIGKVRWSPDGSEILLCVRYRGYDSSAAVIVPRLGGHRRVFPYAAGMVSEITWSPNGSKFITAMPGKSIKIVDKLTGKSELMKIDGPFKWIKGIDWSPKSDLLAFQAHSDDPWRLWTVRLDGDGLAKVLDSCFGELRWSAAGDALYFMRGGSDAGSNLVKLNIDSETGRARGRPRILVEEIKGSGAQSFSSDGRKMLFSQSTYWTNIWSVDLGPTGNASEPQIRQLTRGTSRIFGPTVSPDGKSIAFYSVRDGYYHLFRMPLEGGVQAQLTRGDADYYLPAWSPDGKWLACKYFDGQITRIAIISSSGGSERLLQKTDSISTSVHWAPGNNILYHKTGNRNFGVVDPRTGQVSSLVSNDSVGWMFCPTYSPDLNKVALFWNRYEESTKGKRKGSGIWIVSVGGSAQTQSQLLNQRALLLGWSSEGNWIYFSPFGSKSLKRVRVTNGLVDSLTEIPFEDFGSVELVDSTMIVVTVPDWSSDLWLVEDFDPDID